MASRPPPSYRRRQARLQRPKAALSRTPCPLGDEMPRASAPLDLVPAPFDSQSGSVGRDGVALFDGEPAGVDLIELRDVLDPRGARGRRAKRNMQLHQEVPAHRQVEDLR